MLPVKELLEKLIAFPSVTPLDEGCQEWMMQVLSSLGFQCQTLNNPPVANFFARFGSQDPLLLFAGHTDVVSAGDSRQWQTNPFQLVEKQGRLYGRGVADMKGSLACMLAAAERLINAPSPLRGSLGFLITSGEEGDYCALGTPHVMAQLKQQGIHPAFCIVGEPSSTHRVGDVIRIGRRGSLTAKITLHGKRGHVAYPHLADNPIHKLAPVLDELVRTCWDNGNDYFPPTTLQVTQIEADGQGNNVIPGDISLNMNFRYSSEHTASSLQQAVEAILAKHHITPTIEWLHMGNPFLTSSGRLLDTSVQAIQNQTAQKPELSTQGGTSDGRYIAPYGVEVIELGLTNNTIHQINECIGVDELDQLTSLYFAICQRLLR